MDEKEETYEEFTQKIKEALEEGKRVRKMQGVDYGRIASAWFPIIVALGFGFLLGKIIFDKSGATINPHAIHTKDSLRYGDSTYIMTSTIDSIYSNGTEEYVPDAPSH